MKCINPSCNAEIQAGETFCGECGTAQAPISVSTASSSAGAATFYSNVPIGTPNPALFVILVDQSESMDEPYTSSNKATFAALAVNRCVYEILGACRAGAVIKDRCHIIIIGYGASTQLLVGGRASEVEQRSIGHETYKRSVPDGAGGLVEKDQQLPIWVKPTAKNGTPMEDALQLAGELVEAWARDNPKNFPPIVFNVTDGKPNKADETIEAARRLSGLGTTDGNVLLINCHIADKPGSEIKFPTNASGLVEPGASLLFEISSVIPSPLLAAAQSAGLEPKTNSRLFVMNAAADTFIKLLRFGTLDSLSRQR